MSALLCILICQNFHREIEAVVEAEGWEDVTVAIFPARCGRPPVSWEEVRGILPADCTHGLLLGSVCIHALDDAPANFFPVHVKAHAGCFELVAPQSYVAEAIAEGAYVMTPAWLSAYPDRLRDLGFVGGALPEFFGDFAKELLLLDTGVEPDAQRRLAEISEVLGLPARRIAIGLDYTRQRLARLVLEWRHEQAMGRLRDLAFDRANQLAAMDFMAHLSCVGSEQDVIDAIDDSLRMLFAPEALYYAKFDENGEVKDDLIPTEIRIFMQYKIDNYIIIDNGNGFVFVISHLDEDGFVNIVGKVAVLRLTFPQHLDRYLNLATALSNVCAIAILNARSRKKLADEKRAVEVANKELDAFAYAVSHDLRAPLRAMSGFSQALSEDYGDTLVEGARQYLGEIDQACRTMVALVDGILALSRKTRGDIVCGPVDISEMSARLLAGLSKGDPHRQVECSVEPDMIAVGDGRMLESVLANLLENAWKYTGKTIGATVRVYSECHGDCRWICVADNGAGFDMKHSARLFQPFHRLHRDDEFPGIGIGLATVRRIVQRHGGEIEAYAEPGRGATFRFTLPGLMKAGFTKD